MATSDIFNLTDTWNAGATTFTAIKMNVTDTASASGSLLLDLQVGGSSKASIDKAGTFNTTSAGGLTSKSGVLYLSTVTNNDIQFYINSAQSFRLGGGAFYPTIASQTLGSVSGAWNKLVMGSGLSTGLTYLVPLGSGSLQLGDSDAAAPVAQTLGVQSVVAGTTNTAGTNFTIKGSAGTGTGAGGSIIFQVAPAGSSGTAQNALATALTINSAGQSEFAAGSKTNPTIKFSALAGGFYGRVGGILTATNGSIEMWQVGATTGMGVNTQISLAASGNDWTIAGGDVILVRDAANTLALRNGTAAQTFRVYGTYNGTNDEWIQLDHGVTSANTATILSTKTGSGVARAIEMQVGTARKIRFSTTGGWELFNGAAREGYFNWDAFTVRSDAFVGFASSTTVPGGQGDTNLIRVGAAIMGIRGGNTTTGGVLSLIEQTAPAAPAANGVYIYAEDNGSGKTRLMALFATGAAQQIAIEP